METLSFTYDPLALIRIVLQRFIEENIQGRYYRAKQYACYEYLNENLNDDLLNEILSEFVKRHNLEAITLLDWREDARLIFDIIFERNDYKSVEVSFKRMGFGNTGLGVYDRQAGLFYECGMAHHWRTIRDIVRDSYPEKHEALEKLYCYSRLTEYGGFSREEIENFVMDNFELVGGMKSINEYL
ncbi:hypothetical protein [Paenibacillus solani]|uniref:hypothetical protein n=1 Tax=Paenibacillus solani TaxID=1705565 RepID=UPI003D2BF1F3